MKVEETALAGVKIITPDVFGDHRGYFFESYKQDRYQTEAGIKEQFVQDNQSFSAQGVLRGLHFQITRPQGKLVRVTTGEVFDVAVDINPTSPTFRQWVGVTLSEQNHLQFYVPPGYAHGFVVLSEDARFQYKCTDFYLPSDEAGVLWNDTDIGIEWPVDKPTLSDKDAKLPTLAEYLSTD